MANPKQAADTRPERGFRIGFVSASVFSHAVDGAESKRTMRCVPIRKRYRDGDEWKHVSSFNLGELPQALRVLELALRYVENCEAEFAIDS